MKLYEHSYTGYHGSISVTELEVTETDKLYTVERGCSTICRRIFKRDLGKILTQHYLKPMYLLEKNFDKYKQALIEIKQENVTAAEKRLKSAKEELEEVKALKEEK
ncbi:MAG: hypothetical protein K2H01_11500 [Ruminococcus sp.]|nr:hypothetical protein [Ruminococcus sp.]